MEANFTNHDPAGEVQRTSPLLLGAAVAVIIVSAIGIGTATGVIPRALSDRGAHTLPAVSANSIQPASSSCFSCGTVASIRAVELRTPAGSPSERSRPATTTTILSAAGGIFAGQEFQTTMMRKRYVYRVTLKMDDGSYRTVSESRPPTFGVGQKVKLVDGTLAANS